MERTLRDVIERAEGMVGRGEGGGGHVMMGRCEQARECYERFTGLVLLEHRRVEEEPERGLPRRGACLV